jgi:NAD-dependent deacetylase
LDIKEILPILSKAKTVAVITGAGVSAESGIPTFRGAGGYWRNYKAEELATPEAFERDPLLVWDWYEMRREACAKAQPNPAHDTIALMESYYPNFFLITQNVDGLHTRAGSKKLVQIHGDIFSARCMKCKNIFELWDIPLKDKPPKCPKCHSISRPHIVWFGETYFPGVLEGCHNYLSKCDLIWVIGTSGQVSTPVYLAMHAIQYGAYSIEINPEKTSLSDSVNHWIQGKAGEVLPIIWKNLLKSI